MTTMCVYDVIVAYDALSGGIGKDGELPWRIPQDMQRFHHMTTKTSAPSKKNIVIMGRKTFESLPLPILKNRINIVISGTLEPSLDVSHDAPTYCASFETALQTAADLVNDNVCERIFVIGGQSIYEEALSAPGLRNVYATAVRQNREQVEYDVFFPITRLHTMAVLGMSDWYTCNKNLEFRYISFGSEP